MDDISCNRLYYGDNLDILRKYIPDKSVDLIYLDPPFNSKATYSILFKEPSGKKSNAQVTAFEDTWHWTEEVGLALQELTTSESFSPAIKDALNAFKMLIGPRNDLMAYLTMICIRLNELKRVLKDTGSIYLHCDPTASHYLKILLDSIFGGSTTSNSGATSGNRGENFLNEIIWSYRTGGINKRCFSRKHDVIFLYSKNRNKQTFNVQYYLSLQKYKYGFGKKHGYDLIEGGSTAGNNGQYFKKAFCRDVWDDLEPLGTQGKPKDPRLGYPTQKPIALLERIIKASSNEGDLVLDPFCGSGTTVVAAQSLGRKWIGIDITHLAITLVKKRLYDKFDLELNKDYEVIGEPKNIEETRALAKQNRDQFQWWALSLINAQPYQDNKKESKFAIDGLNYFIGEDGKTKKVIIQVKSGKANAALIRDLGRVLDREKAALGVFITLEEPTSRMKEEALSSGFYKHNQKNYPKIQIITIAELLGGSTAGILGKSIEMPLSFSGSSKAAKFQR